MISLLVNSEKDGKKVMSESYSDKHIASTVDRTMKSMDMDNDGFISYIEYMSRSEK